MSADNYFVIVRSGTAFVPVMMFASWDEPADICSSPEFKTSPRFMSLKEAVQYAENEYTEYGYRISDECWDGLVGSIWPLDGHGGDGTVTEENERA